jgi:hypothetical protein
MTASFLQTLSVHLVPWLLPFRSVPAALCNCELTYALRQRHSMQVYAVLIADFYAQSSEERIFGASHRFSRFFILFLLIGRLASLPQKPSLLFSTLAHPTGTKAIKLAKKFTSLTYMTKWPSMYSFSLTSIHP